jgi:hypothetical protein
VGPHTDGARRKGAVSWIGGALESQFSKLLGQVDLLRFGGAEVAIGKGTKANQRSLNAAVIKWFLLVF